MAKLRKSHTTNEKGNSWFGRVVVFTVLLFAALIASFGYFPKLIDQVESQELILQSESKDPMVKGIYREFLPISSNDKIVHHDYYSLAYNEKREQADWVAYELTKASLQVKNVPRAKRFNVDPKVRSKSAKHNDYSHSGFTRGHLAPAGDMAFDADAMRQCFYMSNMSPQPRVFNNGIWKELEELVRDWAYKKGELYIVTGPIFEEDNPQEIGNNKVDVPSHFYKIVLDKSNNNHLGFIIPNGLSNKKLSEYYKSVNEIEELTNINFFSEVLNEQEEDDINPRGWALSEKKYQQRVNSWNKQ